MGVIVGRPPNFELILKAFPNAADDGVIFAYGPNVYNPSGRTIPPMLLAHEAVHQERQHLGADDWWESYIHNPEFRYNEELLAHVAEFKAQLARGLDRNLRAKLLQSTAQRLVAPLYNYQPPRSLSRALCDLRYRLEKG